MSEFNKDQYAQNRKQKKRGQGSIQKGKVKNNDTATIIFIDNQPTRANRWQRRQMKKGKK